MLRAIAVVFIILFARTALAQGYSGVFDTDSPQGGKVVLQLNQNASNEVSGVLQANGTTLQVNARVTPEGLVGIVTGAQGNFYLLGQQDGSGLAVILAEPAADGQIRPETAVRLAFTRRGDGAPRPPSARPAPGAVPAPPAGGAGDPLATLLTSSAWCGFTYNKQTGTSTTERVVFHGNGSVARTTGAETYNSGAAGSVAGQYGNGEEGRWRVVNGTLQVSEDGMNWAPLPLQITRNSNGAPIIKADGREYAQCR